MSALTYQLKGLCMHNRDGSFATRSNRLDRLLLIAQQLYEGGFKLKSARSLKPKHVHHLIERWQDEGLNTGTIKNRLCDLRWWAAKTNKDGMIPASNEELGIGQRQGTGNRAQALDWNKIQQLPCEKMQAAVALQSAFGLRLEECLYFRPSIADKGDYIALAGKWTKHGKARTIPITHPKQRALLNKAHALAGSDSMVSGKRNFIQGKKALENAALKVGITNLHGHRYAYAQWRYNTITGKPCFYQGGKLPHDMTKAERRLHHKALSQISKELGHERPAITKTYLGA